MEAESPDPRDADHHLTRRAFIGKSAAVAGSMTLLGGSAAHASRFLGAATEFAETSTAGALTATELATLTAVLSQLLPADELGPGAVEAGVPTYIDRSLSGSYKPLLPVYQGLLPLFDAAARSSGAASFADLSAAEQISLLGRFEAGNPPGVGAADAASLPGEFQLLLEHMREGMFGDPMYGGNVDLAGWKLIGYPDIQLETFAKAQVIGATVTPSNKTAKSYGGKPYNGPPV